MAIFLSYSRKNEDVVKSLAQGFEAAKREVWFDHDLEGGDAWWDTILVQIRSATVFVFGLSDESLDSKPCREELDYALALGRPILPVQVGTLTNLRANPLATLQILPFSPDDALSAFQVLAAVDDAAKRERPLPDPLPPPPPIPWGYLLVLRRQIESTELNLQEQEAVVDQLRRALDDETDEGVRHEILAMLRTLNNKPWRTRKTERQVKALLIAHSPESDADEDETTGPGPQRPPEAEAESLPDPAAWFRERIERMLAQKEAAEAGDQELPVWQPSPEAASRWLDATREDDAPAPPRPHAWPQPPVGSPASPSQGHASSPKSHVTAPSPLQTTPESSSQDGKPSQEGDVKDAAGASRHSRSWRIATAMVALVVLVILIVAIMQHGQFA
jgi:TIR domain-containing protein